ncbi:SusD/RagB family nutrient-binding outer membrane lipoprotein [Chitinophaga sp. S165]|uniref:SusD/RagB family nutrient-binding outer membrane lipoprotein n=1 Tax=Chitinophaga sp. S165 TaxID=2135462 RepID=UPI000D714A76|nr:SusD/RagB family nutrient-binding outer membrane lipoprotein [Chitinophaga sp. S165]PWV46170.1 SusD-like starch-binding protein associating with outer membrane [Chitinophaga sp. S165]
MKRSRWSLLLIILLSSCTAGFEEINTNPKTKERIPPGDQLTAAAYFMDGGREMGYPNLYLFQPMVQYLTGPEEMGRGGKYIHDEFYNNCMWENLYGKSLKQLVDLLENYKNDTIYVNYLAAARILRVYVFSLLTDAYGDIPYSQAGLAYYDKIYTPAYDKQADIYPDFFKELSEATAQFDPSKEGIANDIVYNGDLGKWKRLAGSLRLRLAMRLTKANGIVAREQVKAAIAAGVMQNAEDNFRMLHDNYAYPDLRGNGYSQALQEDNVHEWTRGCSTFVEYLKAEKDPRLSTFFVNKDASGNDITAVTNYLSMAPGLYYWDDVEDYVSPEGVVIPATNKYCTLSQSFYHLGNPFLHMGYAEVAFLQAEAAARGWISDDANTWYQTGIRSAIEQLKYYPEIAYISEETVTEFIRAHDLTPGKELEQINMQKWVALFPNGFEAYANQRRSGFPVLAPITDMGNESQTNGTPPKRLTYPSTEAFSNAEHYQDAVNRMGGWDDWLHPVWWNN